MRRGFTLVELAIVLVVIGLIIGGILVARSMVDSVRVQNTIRQTAQFDIAITDFKTKYQYLPGDAPTLQFQDGTAGNGNGVVEDASGTLGLGRAWSGEVANFWPELNQAGMISESPYTATVTGKLAVDGSAPNMPSVPLGVKGAGIFFTNDNGYLSTYNISAVYIIGKVTDNDGLDLSFPNTTPTPAITEVIEDAITPADLLALDTKIDDGKPGSGNVIAFSQELPGASGGCFTADTPAVYNTGSSPACSAAIRYPSVDPDDAPTAAPATPPSPPCGGGTVYPDPGCASSGGTWNECGGNCACAGNIVPGGYILWNGTTCAPADCGCGLGNPCYTWPSSGLQLCNDSSGTWDQCADWCNCPAGTGWSPGTGCGNTCGGGPIYPNPGGCVYYSNQGWDQCDNTCICATGTWDTGNNTCDGPGSCPQYCLNGPNIRNSDCSCNCAGTNWTGVDCGTCSLSCTGGNTPDGSCSTCQCTLSDPGTCPDGWDGMNCQCNP